MVQRRSRFELYVEILDAINRGHSKPTKIMYEANLSWMPLCNMLAGLVEQELILLVPSGLQDRRTKSVFEITKKGLNLLEDYHRANDLMQNIRI